MAMALAQQYLYLHALIDEFLVKCLLANEVTEIPISVVDFEMISSVLFNGESTIGDLIILTHEVIRHAEDNALPGVFVALCPPTDRVGSNGHRVRDARRRDALRRRPAE